MILKNKKNGMKLAVWLLAFALCLLIWPYGVVHKTRTIQTGTEYDHLTEPLSGGVYAVQDFVASAKRLQSIILILDKNSMQSDAGIVRVNLLDEADRILQSRDIPVEEIHSYQDYEVKLNAKLIPGQKYRYSVESLETQGEGPKLVYRSKSRAGVEELGMLSYFGIAELPDAVSMTRLIYQVGLKWYQILVYDAFILFLAALMTSNTNIVFRK